MEPVGGLTLIDKIDLSLLFKEIYYIVKFDLV